MAFDAKAFGAAVKKLRVDSDLTQAELAGKMGLTQAAVVVIEQGKRRVSMETLDKLAEALNVPAECLSVLAFRPMSDVKEVAELSQSLKRLILAVVDARQSTIRKNVSPRVLGVRSKSVRLANTAKSRKKLAVRVS